MAIMHAPVRCPACGEVVPRVYKPRSKCENHRLFGDETELDWEAHERVCSKKGDPRLKSAVEAIRKSVPVT